MIHGDNPFLDDLDSRDPVRRFRGRLSAPVTIVTSGDGEERTGLTVSSLMVVEGEPGRIHAVIGPTTDLWDTVESFAKFVVHVCDDSHRPLAEVFAGLRPSPGGIFAGLEVSSSEWGPVIEGFDNRAYCTYGERHELGYSGIVTATIDRVEIADLPGPLVYFRGSYHAID